MKLIGAPVKSGSSTDIGLSAWSVDERIGRGFGHTAVVPKTSLSTGSGQSRATDRRQTTEESKDT